MQFDSKSDVYVVRLYDRQYCDPQVELIKDMSRTFSRLFSNNENTFCDKETVAVPCQFMNAQTGFEDVRVHRNYILHFDATQNSESEFIKSLFDTNRKH